MKVRKFSFKNDYSEWAHPSILEAFQKVPSLQLSPYYEDIYSQMARELLQKQLNSNKACIEFAVSGTFANLAIISFLLRPYEGVISADIGHINQHESGAIEAQGHKIIPCLSENGKLTVSDIEKVLKTHTDAHKVIPKMVYISNSTELGSVYSKSELQALSSLCRKNNLFLYMDGARLAMALTVSDLDLQSIYQLCDAFYIGGTKNGGLMGEALIINEAIDTQYFRNHLKQKGGLIAKGSSIGLQFKIFFEDNLYFELGQQANAKSLTIARAIEKAGYSFLIPTESNQIFPILPNSLIEEIHQEFEFYIWKTYSENHSVIRLVCSWQTPKEEITNFLRYF